MTGPFAKGGLIRGASRDDDSAPTILARGCPVLLPVITIRPAEPGEDANVTVPCECGAAAQLVINGLERLTQSRELMLTCTCGEVVRYTAGPAGEVAP